MKPTDLLPLITVWLQVRVLPGPPMNQLLIRFSFCRPLGHRTRNALSRCSLPVFRDSKLMIHGRSGHGFSLSIVDTVALSRETAKPYRALALLHGPSTVGHASH